MYLLFFILWIIFNGRITLEIISFGIVISAVMYAFICRFMGFSPSTEFNYLKKSGYIIQYIYILVKEIVSANIVTMKLILTSNYAVEPVLIQFKTDFKNSNSKFLLANSITLTPGTITVALDGDTFTVHCLDKTLAEGIDSSRFIKKKKKIEE